MDNSSNTPARQPLRITVVGAGRLGSALAGALRAAGYDVPAPLGRGAAPAPADVTILCVPDAEIPAAAAAAAGRAPLIGHTSGATGLAALAAAGASAFGLHPLQTFAGGEGPERFTGAGCAVAGTTDPALTTATELATALGMRPFEIDDSGRAAYHAAASIASNYLVALEAAAERVAAGAGLDAGEARALLSPLVQATVDNWAERGPAAALTGPVARGDEATVTRQREAVAATAPELLALFDELIARTRDLAAAEVPA